VLLASDQFLVIPTAVAAVKALLNFAHKVGFTRFNAVPLIRRRRADHARLADARARRSEDDERLRPRQAERLLKSLP
jgi:hypothetical protein